MSELSQFRAELDERNRLEHESGEICVQCWQYPIAHCFMLKDREVRCPMRHESYGGSHGRKGTRYEALGRDFVTIRDQLDRWLPWRDPHFITVWERYTELMPRL